MGENSFDIKVTDSVGAFATATLTIPITAKETDSGTEYSGTGTDDSGTGTEDSGTEYSEKSSSGGSVYYLGLLLLVICLYRRRSYLFA
jgi:hypothetical protein